MEKAKTLPQILQIKKPIPPISGAKKEIPIPGQAATTTTDEIIEAELAQSKNEIISARNERKAFDDTVEKIVEAGENATITFKAAPNPRMD